MINRVVILSKVFVDMKKIAIRFMGNCRMIGHVTANRHA